MLGVYIPVPCLGPTPLVEEILIKSCSAFISNMLQWAIHLSDAGIAYLVFLTPSKQLVQGSTRIRIGSWMETTWCGHKILCISINATNYSSSWIPADAPGE